MYLESVMISEVRQKDKYCMFNLNIESKKIKQINITKQKQT